MIFLYLVVSIGVVNTVGQWHSTEDKVIKCHFEQEERSGREPSGKASRASENELGGVEENGVGFKEQHKQVFRAEPLVHVMT